jgi:WD40 repeat protein/tetratricopeptide (TPR) repeat protein
MGAQLPNPFPGLRPFRSDEHHLFFGREEQTGALLQLLRTNRFLAVVGTSGSGKSSLVRAGMIAELYGGTMTQAGSTWEVMILRPGGSPIENLARAFVEADLYDREDPSTLPRLLATLNRSRFGLVEAMKQCELFEPGTNLLVVVDQFEELFRFRQQGVDSEETAAAFVNLLLTASEQAECPIYVAITMRSDYLGDCSEIPGLAEAVNEGEYLIPRLLRDQKRDAIEKPIGVGGARIAPMLVQRLLNDVGDDPDQLPVLQHALMRMWDAWSTGGDHHRPIDFTDFEATGGLGAALSHHADEIYDALPDDRHRSACEKLFKTLTEKGDDNRGIRRPTRLAQLQAIAASDRDMVTTVLDAYRGSGVTFLMPGSEVELTDRTVLDLSHESLMRGWQRLRMWVEDEAQSARIFRRLLDTARLWSDGKAGLFRDPDLQIALSWREQEAPNAEWAEQYGGDFETAIGFLEASNAETEAERHAREAARQRELDQARQLAEAQQLRLEQQQRAAFRLRLMIAGLAAVAVIAGLACVAALLANQRAITLADQARQNEEKAKENATRAELSQQDTAKALAVVASQKAEVEGSLSKAEAAEEAGRKLLYTTDMRLAPFVWRDGRSTAEQLRVLLAKHIPGNTDVTAATRKPDLRGFEWYYYQHLLEDSAAVFSGHADSVVAGAFTADGPLVTLDQNGQLRRWDLGSQAEDPASRRDLPGGPAAQVRVLSPDGRLAALAEGNKVRVFDTATGHEKFAVDSASRNHRRPLFSRDGDRLVIVDDKIRWLSAASGERIASLDENLNGVRCLALSADGLTLAVGGYGSFGALASIFRLDAAAKTVTPLATGVGTRDETQEGSALTADGGWLAVSMTGTLNVFDAATGRLIARHTSAHASRIVAIAFSGDGARLATADVEGTIKIWADLPKLDSKSAALLTLKGHQGAINTVGFSSDGKRLVTASADKTARVWDLENVGAAIRPLEGLSDQWLVRTRFSPDGQLIAAATGRSLRLWDAATGRLVRELPPVDRGQITGVAFSPTDHRLLAVGYGGEVDVSYVALWDIDAGTERARLSGATDLPDFEASPYNGQVGALAFSPDGKYLVAGFGDKTLYVTAVSPYPLKVWEVASGRLIRRLNGHTGYCISLDFSRDGALLASGSRDGTARIWSTETWKAMHTLQNPDRTSYYTQTGRGKVEDVAFSPDGKTLALASHEGNVQLWDVATGKLRETLKGHSSAVEAVVFSPDGRTLASGSGDQTVRLWNVETRRELMQLDPGGVELGYVRSLSFSPDGRHLLAGGSGTAFWSITPIAWNDPDRAAEKLQLLLHSNADFQGRIRMLSENLRLHEALAKLDANDRRVQAALAATQANWHASRKAWPEAVAAFDRLVAADPRGPEAWLRTPGLLRLATALLHQNRPSVAAMLLQGGAKRRTADGIPPAVDRPSIGVTTSTAGGQARVTELLTGSPASRTDLRPGDVILKVNDTELTRDSLDKLDRLLSGEAGTKIRLTVRHSGSEKPAVIELTRERFVNDPATGDHLDLLRALVKERLTKEPRDARLLELRAELAGQWSDAKAQVADYTGAIESLAQQKPEAAAADLKRLYGRRGNAYVALKQWQQALGDYSRVVTDARTDESLLSNQALALAESLLLPDVAGVDTIVSTSENERMKWHFTTEKPADEWAQPDFNDSKWQVGMGPFGTANVESAHTAWLTTDIWLRRGFEFPNAKNVESLFLRINCDDDAQVFVNGTPVARQESWTSQQFIIIELERRVRDLIVPGRNIVAVHCKNWDQTGWGYVDVGLYAATEGSLALTKRRLAAPQITDPWQELADAYQIKGDQRAIDQLVQRRPKLAGSTGDLFTQGPKRDWQRAVEIYSVGIKARPSDVELLSKRARAYEAIRNWDAAAADWSRAASGNPDGARLLGEFARRLAAADQRPLVKAQFEKSEALYARSLAADPENDLVAAELARLRLDQQENEDATRWTVLKPSEVKSKNGATLSKLPDDSILASGKNPLGDAYTIIAPTPVTPVRAIRLEALTHESLPNQGPGRSERTRGNFAMVNFKIMAHIPGTQPRPIEFSRVAADHHFLELTASHWNLEGGQARPHTAVYLAEQPVDCKDGTRLEVKMEFSDSAEWPLQNLGRFRLSVSRDPAAFDREQTRFAARKLTDPWATLAVAYALDGRHDEALRYFSRALEQADGYEARKPIVELAARFDEVHSALIKRQPDDPQLPLALARRLAERGRQRLAEKRPAEAQADLQKAGEILTHLGLRAPSQWVVLKPTEMKSKAGTTLTFQSDGSILASGASPDQETYTVVAKPGLATIGAVRLETLPHPSLPKGGSGRDSNGSFWLNEFTVSMARPGAPPAKDPLPSRIHRAVASFHRTGATIDLAIDGNLSTQWSAWPEVYRRQEAVFDLRPNPENMAASMLVVQLTCIGNPEWRGTLGCFRLSVMSGPDAFFRALLLMDLKQSELADLSVALAEAHAQQGHIKEADASFAEALSLAADRAGKARIITAAAPLAGALEKLAERAAEDGLFQAELAQHYSARGNAPAATAARARACALLAEKLAQEPENTAMAADLLLAYQSAGRTREAIPFLTKASTANPNHTLLSLEVAAFQAWFGQEKELAATRQRIRAFAEGTNDAGTAEQAAKACSIVPSTDKAELDAALALARKGVELQKSEGGREWRLLALGMAEYRCGNDAAAAEAMLAAAQAAPNSPYVMGTSALYRAMSLFRQGKKDEARKLAIGAAARMKPLPKDEQNPLPNDASPWDDLILWLAYKEAKATIKFDVAPAVPATAGGK